MFISETYEAMSCGVTATKEDVVNSNSVFAEMMRKTIMKEQSEVFNSVSKAYDKYAKEANNNVARYNHERLILI
jgi:hemerythrin-like domain-containing protein